MKASEQEKQGSPGASAPSVPAPAKVPAARCDEAVRVYTAEEAEELRGLTIAALEEFREAQQALYLSAAINSPDPADKPVRRLGFASPTLIEEFHAAEARLAISADEWFKAFPLARLSRAGGER